METQTKNNNLNHELAQFSGSENYYKNFLGLLITDGVKYFGEKAQANWAISDIACILKMHKKVKAQEFVSVKITSKSKKATIKYEDGNNNILYKQHYTYTDLPTGEYTLYYANGTLCLQSEY